MKTIRRLLINHPSTDFLISLALLTCLFSMPQHWTELPEDKLVEFLSALATIAGTLMATITFVCALLYQSVTPRYKMLIERYGDKLTSAWTTIIGTALGISATSVLLIGFSHHTNLVSKIAIAQLFLLCCLGARATWWLNKLFQITNIESTTPPRAQLKDPKLQTLQYQN